MLYCVNKGFNGASGPGAPARFPGQIVEAESRTAAALAVAGDEITGPIEAGIAAAQDFKLPDGGTLVCFYVKEEVGEPQDDLDPFFDGYAVVYPVDR